MRCFAKIGISPYAWKCMYEQYTKLAHFHLKSDFGANGNDKMFKQCTKFEFHVFPPKIKWNGKCSYDDNACHVMQDLESRDQEKNVQKRVIQFGALVEKLCTFEVQTTLGHVWSISLQPYMRNSWSWTFWKWESKIFNFHVGQNFIWSFLDDVILKRKPFHFWQIQIIGHFLFLESFDLTLFSSMLMFEMSNETCLHMNEASLTISLLQIHGWTDSWLLLTF